MLSEDEVLGMTDGMTYWGAVSESQKLFGGWMRSDTSVATDEALPSNCVGDASKGRSSEPCSGCYRASAVGFLSEIHKGVGLRQSAKQLLMLKTVR